MHSQHIDNFYEILSTKEFESLKPNMNQRNRCFETIINAVLACGECYKILDVGIHEKDELVTMEGMVKSTTLVNQCRDNNIKD